MVFQSFVLLGLVATIVSSAATEQLIYYNQGQKAQRDSRGIESCLPSSCLPFVYQANGLVSRTTLSGI